jgi:hypothetical protein
MSTVVTYALLFFMSVFTLFILLELLVFREIGRFLIELAILLSVVITLRATTGFPTTREAFGGASPVAAIGLMLACTLLGIAARHFFYLKGKFSWRLLLKPLCISPIVLLPLIGSVQGTSNLEAVQMISFGFLSFQNGFFWEVVLEQAKKEI